MQNYERTATGTYRCYIDNREYKRVEEIPDYGDWAVAATYPNLDPQLYRGGSDITKLPDNSASFEFLKKGAFAKSSDGTLYVFNCNTQSWEEF